MTALAISSGLSILARSALAGGRGRTSRLGVSTSPGAMTEALMPLPPLLEVDGAGESMDAVLGGRVGDASRGAGCQPRPGRDVDDVAAPRGPHGGQGVPGEEERTGEVGVNDAAPVGNRACRPGSDGRY